MTYFNAVLCVLLWSAATPPLEAGPNSSRATCQTRSGASKGDPENGYPFPSSAFGLRFGGGFSFSLAERWAWTFVDGQFPFLSARPYPCMATEDGARRVAELVKRYSLPDFEDAYMLGGRYHASAGPALMAQAMGYSERYMSPPTDDANVQVAKSLAIADFERLRSSSTSGTWAKRDRLYAGLAEARLLDRDARPCLLQAVEREALPVDRSIAFTAAAMRVEAIARKRGHSVAREARRVIRNYRRFSKYVYYQEMSAILKSALAQLPPDPYFTNF